jgi:hypothetical protein
MINQFEFRRDERPAEPAEEIFSWSVQLPLDHQITFGELCAAIEAMRRAYVVDAAKVQLNGNQLMAWHRQVLK